MEQRSLGVALADGPIPVPGRQDARCWGFGAFRLDLPDTRLWCGQEVVHLHPKTFAVLCCLVARAGQLVTKDTLLETVWPETVVSEAVLQVAIRELRRVLGDQARAPQFIETVHSRGYRFIAPVSPLVVPGAPERLEAPRHVPSPLFSPPQHFVGREAELTQLTQGWTVARQGTRQVVIIAGEPGIGKTALVDTFIAQVAADENFWVGHGQCIEPYGVGEPYLPVLEALGRLGQGPEGTRLVAVLRQYAPSWLMQMPALLPPTEWEALQRTVGSTAQARMLRELTEALDALTAKRPFLLVLEDLHWSDRATLEWLTYVARRPDPARLMILGTYRPVDAIVHTHPLRTVLTELRQHGQCVELALDYLCEAAVTAYLCQRFGSTWLATALGRALHQRTNGNPLFLIAVVDELVRQQGVTEGATGWEVRGGVETITAIVPAHLQALIEHQLARSSPEEQTLLAAASVAGVEFAASAVAAGLEYAEDVVEARCTALAHQGRFLQTHGRAVWPDGTVTACYRFIHALYQEVVYQQLPAGRQSHWHARVGSRLAQGFGERVGDIAAALAMHFLRGHRLPQAIQYARLAGQTAARRGAYQEAVTYYEQALHALQQLPDSHTTRDLAIDLCCDLRHALSLLGEFRRLLDHLRQAEPLAEALSDCRRRGQLASYIAACLMQLGDPDGGLASAQRALALATVVGEVGLHVTANYYLGEVYLYGLNDYQRAAEVLRRNVATLHDTPLRERFGGAGIPSVSSHALLVMCLAELGVFAEGRAYGEEALPLAEAVKHPYSLTSVYTAIGHLALCQGDLLQAIHVLERGRALSDTVHLPILMQACSARLGAAYILAGRVSAALPLLMRALEQNVAMGYTLGYPPYAVWLGEGYMLAGRVAEALPLGQRALEVAQAQKQQGWQAYALRLLGEITVQGECPDVEQATVYYRHALTLAEALGMRPLQAHCHRGLGVLYGRIGRGAQARAELTTAITLYRSMNMTFWLPQAEAALAQMDVS